MLSLFSQLWMGATVCWSVMCEEVGGNELERLRSFNSGLSHIIVSELLYFLLETISVFSLCYSLLSQPSRAPALDWAGQHDSVKCLELEVFCGSLVVNFCSMVWPTSVELLVACLSPHTEAVSKGSQKMKMMCWYNFSLTPAPLLFCVMELFP